MTRKKKGRGILGTIILILIILILVLVLIIIIKNNLSLDSDTKKEDTPSNELIKTTDNPQETINETITISCEDYDVYFDDDVLGFNFIIAKLSFDSTSSTLYYDLANLTTSEKIKLDSCEFYLSKIQSFNYDLSEFNLLNNQFSSDGSHMSGNVFIPFTDNKGNLSVYNGEEIKFDLSKNNHNINELFYDIKTEDIKTEKYDISVSNSYEEFEFVKSGEPFACPLALVFELSVNSISSKNVYVEAAKYIPDGASFEIDAMDDQIDSYKIVNVLNKKLKSGDTYGLFFQISEQTNRKGRIMVKMSDSENWIELKEVPNE